VTNPIHRYRLVVRDGFDLGPLVSSRVNCGRSDRWSSAARRATACSPSSTPGSSRKRYGCLERGAFDLAAAAETW